MCPAGTIVAIVFARRRLLALRVNRTRGLSVMSVAVAVVVRMSVLIMRYNSGCLISAAANSICPRRQNVRGTTAQSWTQEHCEVEVRDYGKPKHKSQPRQRISSLRLYSPANSRTIPVRNALFIGMPSGSYISQSTKAYKFQFVGRHISRRHPN